MSFLKKSAENKFDYLKIPLVKKDKQKLFWALPAIAWNNYDKTQLGLLLGADIDSLLKIRVTPMYGLGSTNLTGIISSSFFLAQKKKYPIELSFNAKRFTYLLFPEDLAYNTINPGIKMQLMAKDKSSFHIGFDHKSVWQEYLFVERKTNYFFLNHFTTNYTLKQDKISFTNNNNIEIAKQFGIIRLENTLKVNYTNKSSNAFHARLSLGLFIHNSIDVTNIEATRPILMLSGTPNIGIHWLQKDYGFDDLYFDRNGQDNFFRHQTVASDGGFNSMTNIGNADQAMLGLNLKSDVMLPDKVKRIINLQAYANAALSKNKNLNAEIYAEAGASLQFWNGIIGVYIPFITTKNIQQNQESIFGIQQREWTKRITFSVDLLKLKNTYDN